MNQEELNKLQSRQLELLALMGKSDAHAAKCAKLGVKFSDEYPDDLEEYEAAMPNTTLTSRQLPPWKKI